MTVGSYTYDHQVPVYSPETGTSFMGSRSTKSWSGGDSGSVTAKQPKSRPIRVTTLLDPEIRNQDFNTDHVEIKSSEQLWLEYAQKAIQKADARDRRALAIKHNKAVRKGQVRGPLVEVPSSPPKSQRKLRTTPPKRARFRSPNDYTMTASREFNPFMGTVEIINSFGNPHATYTNCTFKSVIGLNFPDYPPFDANDTLTCIGRLADRIRGNSFNTSVFLAESHQTLTMIGDAAYRLAFAYRHARKGRFDQAAKFLAFGNRSRTVVKRRNGISTPTSSTSEVVASSWLELQWGWKPLIRDMVEGAELLAHQLSVPFVQKYSASYKKRVPAAEIDAMNIPFKWNGQVYASKRIVAYVSEPASLPELLGLFDPELVVWEVTPFSMLADYIAPIQQYLDARAFASRHVDATFVTTFKRQREFFGATPRRFPLVYPVTGIYTGHGYGDYRREDIILTRTVSSSLSVPKPVVKPLSEIATWKHAANSLALLAQVLTGSKVKSQSL